MMAHKLYRSVDGIPVGVDVEHGHEHRELDNLALQIFAFKCAFKCNYRSVDRRYDHSVAVAGEMASW